MLISTFIKINVTASLWIDHKNGIAGFVHYFSELNEFFLRLLTLTQLVLQSCKGMAEFFCHGVKCQGKRSHFVVRKNRSRSIQFSGRDARDRLAEQTQRHRDSP